MILFPSSFLSVLIYGGVVMAAAGAGVLLVLFARDATGKRLW